MKRPAPNRLLLLSPLLTALSSSAFTPPLTTTHHVSKCHVLHSTSNKQSLTPTTNPSPLATSGDWSAYLDESRGLIYYFHRRTGQSSWDLPDGVEMNVELSGEKKKEMRERLRGYLEERLGDAFVDADGMLNEQSKGSSNTQPSSSTNEASVSKSTTEILTDKRRSGILATHRQWIALIDEKRGMIYYHDEASNTTTWNRPKDFPYIKLTAVKRRELQEQNRRYLEWRREGTVKIINGKNSGASSKIGEELDSLNRIQKDIDDRLKQVELKQDKVEIYRDGQWTAYWDDRSGLVYYYNEVEKKSVWDAPSEEFLDRVKERMMEDPKRFAKVLERDEKTPVVQEKANEANANNVSDDTYSTLQRSSIDYDAATRLAYKASGSVGDFDKFKTKYLSDTSNMVATKHKSRMEEAAQVAQELKTAKEEQMQQEMKLAKSPVDYYAAARLSYESSGSVGEFDDFKAKYLVDTSMMVAEKFKARLEATKAPVKESAVESDKVSKQTAGVETKPFFLQDIEDGIQEPSTESTEQQVQFFVSSRTEVDEFSIDLETDEPTTTQPETSEPQPNLPKEDPFTPGANVTSLITPLKTKTLYDILQCDITATCSEIKKSYLTLAKETHPDALLQNGINDKDAEKRFNEIARAYKILSDPTERRRYNRELKAKGISRSAGSMFENWVMGAAKVMDEALSKAERDLESGRGNDESG